MILKDQKGAALVEFALVVPLILYILVGILQFGWLVNSYIMLVNATDIGARFFAEQASSSTANSGTLTQITTSASGLTGSLSITTSVNGTACNDSTCGAALTANQGKVSQVTATYTFTPLVPASFYLLPANLTYSTQERVLPVQ